MSLQEPQELTPLPRARSETALATIFRLVFELTPNEGRLLARIMLRGHVGSNNNVKVAACTLRAKLQAHDIKISCRRGIGYTVDSAGRAIVRARLAAYDAEFHSARRPRPKAPKSDSTVAAEEPG